MFASLYHLFCGFKNAQKQPCVSVLQNRCSSKCCKIYRKTLVPLATLLKKDTGVRVCSCEFFEIIKDNFFIKHLRATTSEC